MKLFTPLCALATLCSFSSAKMPANNHGKSSLRSHVNATGAGDVTQWTAATDQLFLVVERKTDKSTPWVIHGAWVDRVSSGSTKPINCYPNAKDAKTPASELNCCTEKFSGTIPNDAWYKETPVGKTMKLDTGDLTYKGVLDQIWPPVGSGKKPQEFRVS